MRAGVRTCRPQPPLPGCGLWLGAARRRVSKISPRATGILPLDPLGMGGER